MKSDYHLGRMLSRLVSQKRFRRSEITGDMKVSNSAFYGYEMRPSLQSSIIFRLCHAMKYNLLMDMANTLPADYEYDRSKATGAEAELAQLKEEVKKLQWENQLLREMMIKKV